VRAAAYLEGLSINQKLKEAIENEWRAARIEGLWWQFSLTERTVREPSAISLWQILRDCEGALKVGGRGWQEDGTCPCDIGARLRRRGKILPASSTIGMANGRGTRTRSSFTGLERSHSSLLIARPGTGNAFGFSSGRQ
jgi:hypothetical protein